MTCRLARRHETEYLDGVLAPPLAAALNAHRRTCLRCDRRLSELAGTLAALKEVTAPLPPGNLFARIILGHEKPARWSDRLADFGARLLGPLSPQQLPSRLVATSLALVVLLLAAGLAGGLVPEPSLALARAETALRPDDLGLVRFAQSIHAIYDANRLTVIARVPEAGRASIAAVATRSARFAPVDARSDGTGPARIVVLVFESILVTSRG